MQRLWCVVGTKSEPRFLVSSRGLLLLLSLLRVTHQPKDCNQQARSCLALADCSKHFTISEIIWNEVMWTPCSGFVWVSAIEGAKKKELHQLLLVSTIPICPFHASLLLQCIARKWHVKSSLNYMYAEQVGWRRECIWLDGSHQTQQERLSGLENRQTDRSTKSEEHIYGSPNSKF